MAVAPTSDPPPTVCAPVPAGTGARGADQPHVAHPQDSDRDVTVVAAPAEIDITVAEQFRALLMAASAGEHPTVVVDMTGTSFCDSAGLHTLVRAHKRAAADGGQLRLVIPAHSAVARIITLTRLNLVIPCFATVAEAVTGKPLPPSSGGPARPAAQLCRGCWS